MGNYFKRTPKNICLISVVGVGICLSMMMFGSIEIRRPEVINLDRYIFRDMAETSKTWQQISPWEAYERFQHKASSSCNSICDKDLSPACSAKTFKEWDKLFTDGRIEGVPLFKDDEYVFPFEKDYLSLPPLENVKQLPDLGRSIIYHLDNKGNLMKKKKMEVTCRYLDRQRFRLDLIDGYGNSRTRGGDEVRVWLTGNPRDPLASDYKASGHVLDLQNGSYIATITCPWLGHAELRIGLAYPWEYLRSALHQFQHGVHVFVAGTFRRDSVEELTICQSHPNVPGRPCLCNMTDWNQMPFYCGRPLDKRLSCRDIVGTISMPFTPRLLYTPAEKEMSNMYTRSASQMLVHQKVEILVKDEGGRALPKTPCSQLKKSVTWRFKNPRGFWSTDNKWTSLMCHQQDFSVAWARQCLTDTTVWIFGDSNGKQLFKAFRRWVPCQGTPVKMMDWHFCFEKEHRINITYVLHENTVYSNKTRTMPNYVGLNNYVDLIPDTGRHFVIFHYFLHPSRAHPTALYFRLKNLKRMITRLLKRNPDIHIAVRGPHISTMQVMRNHMLGGDVLGSYAMALYHEVFRDLRDQIIFLDGWDMTVALENPDYHPITQVADELARTFLSFKCD